MKRRLFLLTLLFALTIASLFVWYAYQSDPPSPQESQAEAADPHQESEDTKTAEIPPAEEPTSESSAIALSDLTEISSPATVSAALVDSAANATPAEDEPTTTPSGVAKTEALPASVLATRRMVAAHAPLRAPSVADPDSRENQRILQSMITKALSNGSTEASTSDH